MSQMQRLLNLYRDDSAQDLIEYALLAALIALATLASTRAVGETLMDTFWVRIAGMLSSIRVG